MRVDLLVLLHFWYLITKMFLFSLILVQINNAEPEKYVLQGGGLPGSYVFDQMHFHWSAEHTINGKR